MQQKKSTLIYRTDLVNVGIGQGQRETVPYLASQTDFDETGRILTQMNYAPSGILAEKVIFEYDHEGRVAHETSIAEDGEFADEKTYEYDNEGRLVKQFKHYIDGTADITSFQYNIEGQVIKKITVDDEGETESTETFTYQDGRLIAHEIVDGEDNRLLYDEYAFDVAGKMVQHIRDNEADEEYFRLVFSYNSEGRKLSEALYDFEDNLLETTWFEEDEKGRVVQTVEESNRSRRVKQFSFDDHGNNLGYEETNASGDKMVVVEHRYDEQNNPQSSLVFVNGVGRTISQHYELKYEYEWY